MRTPLLIACLGLAACKDPPTEPLPAPIPRVERTPEPSSLPAGHPPINTAGHGNTAGHAPAQPHPSEAEHPLRWRDPAGWRSTPPSSTMRKAQYAIPGAAGDAEMAVFFFGVGQGGDIEQNLQRWYGQFERTDAPPTRASRTVRTMRATVTYASGRFNAGSMGAGPAGPRDDWALLGAIVETPQGPWFFKLTGPRATVSAARAAFDTMVDSMEW